MHALGRQDASLKISMIKVVVGRNAVAVGRQVHDSLPLYRNGSIF